MVLTVMSAKELGVALGGVIIGAAAATFVCGSVATASDEAAATAASHAPAVPAAAVNAATEEPAGNHCHCDPETSLDRLTSGSSLSVHESAVALRTPPREHHVLQRVPSSDELDLAATPSRIAKLANSKDLPILQPLDMGAISGGNSKMRRRRPGWGRSRRQAGKPTMNGPALQPGAEPEADAAHVTSDASGECGSGDQFMNALRSSQSLPQLAAIAKRNRQQLSARPLSALHTMSEDDFSEGADGCRWVLPEDFQVGRPFSVRLMLGPTVSVRRGDFIALYAEGGPDYDFGQRKHLVTADRLLDGFRWTRTVWESSGAYSGVSEDGATPTKFHVRYFRSDWRDGPIFVSPSFSPTVLDAWSQGAPASVSTPVTPRAVAEGAVSPDCEDVMMIESASDPREVGMSASRLTNVSNWAKEWVDSGKVPGMSVAIARHGKLAYMQTYGDQDVDQGVPFAPDTIVRLYSMSKPLVSAAAMILYEKGKFQLDDLISEHLPEFKAPRVYVRGGDHDAEPTNDASGPLVTEPAKREITFHDLLTHTSVRKIAPHFLSQGISYGDSDSAVDKIFRRELEQSSWEDSFRNRLTLEEFCKRIARAPLLFHPGSSWRYSYSTDVLGRCLELLSGEPLDKFLQAHVFRPLKMVDTGFFVPPEKAERLAKLYQVNDPDVPGENTDGAKTGDSWANGLQTPRRQFSHAPDSMGGDFLTPPVFLESGGGLVSTASDYLRFAQMLLNCGELDGVRILSRKIVQYMTCNHLPTFKDGSHRFDLESFSNDSGFSESAFEGMGFGLGFSVMTDPIKACIVGSRGEYSWGGWASTVFWIDPSEDMVVMQFAQLVPSDRYPLRRQLKVLTYQTIVDEDTPGNTLSYWEAN